MNTPVPFYLDSQPVGEFEAEATPTFDGDYSYEPYRGPGHYNLQVQLKSSHTPRCHYTVGSERVEFSVVAYVRDRVLRLSGFESSEVSP
jgi:hypothetical protein